MNWATHLDSRIRLAARRGKPRVIVQHLCGMVIPAIRTPICVTTRSRCFGGRRSSERTESPQNTCGQGLGQFDVAATEKQHRDELGGGRAAVRETVPFIVL